MSASGDWREVSKREPCPVCNKPDWCSVVGPEGAVEACVCMREESGNARPNGGWFHRIRESGDWQPPAHRGDKPRTFGTAAEAIAAMEKQLGPRSRVWKYFNAAGEPVGVVARWDRPNSGKEIRPVSRVAGGWVIGAMAEPRPLYDLPAIATAQAVFVCEGEKAADAIRSLDLAATTSSGGSAAAAKTDWAPLAGKTVCVWPDNDAPGQKYLAAVAAELSKLSPRPTVSVIRPAGMPDKADAADWLASGGTREKLEQLVQSAERVKLEASPAKQESTPKQITLREAAQQYIDRLKAGTTSLIEFGVPELDYSIGGGVEFGEMIIAAARPSHGKSAFAMQAAHHWTAQGIPTLIVSEEMSALALGKRALQFASNVPQEHWSHSTSELERDLSDFASSRAACIISEPCVTPKAVMESIERNIGEHGIRAVAIDYAQLLRGEGRSRYEQVSFVSNRLREAASRYNVLLLTLAQLNREVEKRAKFIPSVADIRDAGTLEQDADVILLLAWPHMVDPKQPPNQYQIFVAKNRNRPINQQLVVCRFDPSRQMISEATAREMPNYRAEFGEFEAERRQLAGSEETVPW